MLYYVISQDFDKSDDAFEVIKQNTHDKSIVETQVGEPENNWERTIYGFQVVTDENSQSQITITGKLESQATHYLTMYCENLAGKTSSPKNMTWVQKTNSGKPLLIRMDFFTGSSVNNYSLALD